MLTSGNQSIHNFVFHRLTQIRDEIIMNDPEYRKLGEISLELMKQLAAKLSPEDNDLLDQYDSSRMNQMNRQDVLIYIQGLMDGIYYSSQIVCFFDKLFAKI